MSILIDLFKDDLLCSSMNRVIGQLFSRQCKINTDVSFYEDLIPDSIYQKSHIKNVLSALKTGKSALNIYGKLCDSYADIEKLGICRYCADNTVIVSLEDSLDYILHFLSGCDINTIYNNVSDYKELSRGILNVDFSLLDTHYFDELVGIDPLLDKYLVSILDECDSDCDKFVIALTSNIINSCNQVLEYIAISLRNMSQYNLIFRSKSLTSAIFTSNTSITDIIILKCDNKSSYSITPLSFKKLEYLNKCDDTYRGGIV